MAPKADSHVFPKAIFKRVKEAQGGEDYLLALSRDGSKPPARIRIGEYDTEILCQGCEHKHHGVDTQGIKALLQVPYKSVRVYGKAQLLSGYSDQANARDIRNFLYFTLLKAGWSKRSAYAHVELDPGLERHLRRVVEEGVEPEGSPTPIFLIRHGLVEPGLLSTPTVYHGAIIVAPRLGYTIYQLSIYDMSAMIFAGEKAPAFGKTEEFELRDGRRVHILRSERLDASMEAWVTEVAADRLRSGGGKWER